MKIRKYFYPHVKKRLGDGRNTRFWEDWWVGDKSLKEAYPSLFFISNDQGITVREAIDKDWGGFTFRRALYGDTEQLWNSMRARCEEVLMHGGRDKSMWMLTADRKFTVKSLYRDLIKSDVGFPRKFLWN